MMGIGVVITMIFSLDIGETLFSGKVFYPMLAVSSLVSPFLERYMKL